MNTSPFLTRSRLSPNLAITIFVIFAVSIHISIPKQLPPSPLPFFTRSLTTATFFITTCPSLRSPGSTDPELSCTCLLSKLHSYPLVSALVKNNPAHRMQAPFTYLQSSPNLHTSITSSQLASSQHSLFIFGHTCSSIYIIFSTYNRLFLPVRFPSSLESTLAFSPSTVH